MKTSQHKLKKILPLLISAVLVLGLLVQFADPAIASGDDVYRIVLRYYDPIQITYNIKYPVNDGRGEWTGPEDVPIGGVGVPGSGQFDISSYISTQIYCVDPFTPFHGRVPGLGGDFLWNGGAMADTVSGYVEAAPWNMSGAMQMYGDAVRWIAANGYRGVYNYGKTDDHPESVKSIQRLNAMFPGIGPIDREIAVMATKVAIWKTIAGDSVQVLKTTLDGRPSKKATFDALVQGLVDKAALQPASVEEEVTVTTFDIVIREDIGVHAFYDESGLGSYNYYGPMNVTADLGNARAGSSLADMDRLFLTASGINSDDVLFVSDTYAELPEGKLFGTSRNEQYIIGNGTDNTWISDDFYLAIPKARDPDHGDELLVHAMAMAPEVPVVEGTPIVYAFTPPGTDIQDWNAIQAFIGGASGETKVNLYAEAKWDTGRTTLGELSISKQVENAALENMDHEFTFAVYYSKTSLDANPPKLNLTDYPVRGAFSVNTGNNTFTLKNGGFAFIEGLPMVVSGGGPGYEYYYWVEEVSPGPNYGNPYFELNAGNPSGLTANGSKIGPFQLNDVVDDIETHLAYVTVTNTYEHNTGSLIINKKLAGSPGDWGVNDATAFTARVKDLTGNNYVLFEHQPNGTYKAVGNNNSANPTNDLRELVRFTAGSKAEMTNLWAGRQYKVEETGGNHYTTSYNKSTVSFPSKGREEVVITNDYEHGTGSLVISKKLTGNPEDWGVDDTTVFTARVKDITNNNYVFFDLLPDGTYWANGNNGSPEPSDNPRELVRFTAGSSAVMNNLWAGYVYQVEETEGEHYTASYQGNGVSFPTSGNMNVVITNDYEHGTGSLVISKKLTGCPGDWSVDDATVFTARVKDVTDNNFVLFDLQSDGTYWANGNNGSPEPSDNPRELVRFTAGNSAELTNLWAGQIYEIVETGAEYYTPSYEGNEVSFPESGNMIVVVTNDYEHGTGSLVIKKKLTGAPGDWGVNDGTAFTVKIKDITGGNYLLFKTDPEADGSYWCVGNNVDGLSEPYAGATTMELTVTAKTSLAVVNLWSNHVYEIEELAGNGYTTSYINNVEVLPNGQSGTVTVVNNYEPKESTTTTTTTKPIVPSGTNPTTTRPSTTWPTTTSPTTTNPSTTWSTTTTRPSTTWPTTTGPATTWSTTKPENSENPKTGDNNAMSIWLWLGAVNLFVIVLTVAAGRRRKTA